jgi:hypothetical protein
MLPQDQLNLLIGEQWTIDGLSAGSASTAQVVWSSATVDIYPQTEGAIGRELGSNISGDVILINIGFVLIGGYTILVFFKFHPTRSRALLAISAIVSCVLAIGVAYGFCTLLGFEVNPVITVLPFILLGIGVDDAFVLVNELEATNPKKPPAERIALAIGHAGVSTIHSPLHSPLHVIDLEAGTGPLDFYLSAGDLTPPHRTMRALTSPLPPYAHLKLPLAPLQVSITITSVTDLLAFALGTTSALPALATFCFFAAIGITADFLVGPSSRPRSYATSLPIAYARTPAHARLQRHCPPPTRACSFSAARAHSAGPHFLSTQCSPAALCPPAHPSPRIACARCLRKSRVSLAPAQPPMPA